MKQIILLFEITNNKSLNYTLRERTFLFFSSGKLKSTKVGAIEKSKMQEWLKEQSS